MSFPALHEGSSDSSLGDIWVHLLLFCSVEKGLDIFVLIFPSIPILPFCCLRELLCPPLGPGCWWVLEADWLREAGDVPTWVPIGWLLLWVTSDWLVKRASILPCCSSSQAEVVPQDGGCRVVCMQELGCLRKGCRKDGRRPCLSALSPGKLLWWAWSWEMASLSWGKEGRLLWASRCCFGMSFECEENVDESGVGGKRMHCNFCLKEKITILITKRNMPNSYTMSRPQLASS